MNQDKNTIKIILAIVLMIIIGEGVLGWGLYWPLILAVSDWDGAYWLSLLGGVLISVLAMIEIGLPSLFVVVAVAALSFLFKSRRGAEWWFVLISVILNIIFDKLFGLSWSLWEMVGVLMMGLAVLRWETRGESIKVNYR